MFVPENLKRGLDLVCIRISCLVFVVLFRSILNSFTVFLQFKITNNLDSTPKEFIS